MRVRAWTRGTANVAEGLVGRHAWEGQQYLLPIFHGLAVVTQVEVEPSHFALDRKLELDISEGSCHSLGALTVGQHQFVVPHLP
jgi:hypothetical protein